ncbi:YqzE family protein [Virgibacillus sp. W0181]|uniref:YqzE family protein n=1 Tax=Virgibacillus sp. W0181 TaxID=3391581 RepID=UPI003F46B70A
MSINDLVRYVTEQFVSYVDMPADEKKQRKLKRAETQQKQQNKLSNHWFGVFPLALKTLWKKNK